MAGIATHFGARKTPYYQNREMLNLQSQAAKFDPSVNHLGQRRVGRRVVGTPQRTVAGQDPTTMGAPPNWAEAFLALKKRRRQPINLT